MPTPTNSNTPPRNILCLDGGGTWAIIQVMTLQKLYGEDVSGHDVLQNFDLVAANSGGSIIAAGLFLDLKLSDILDLLNTQANRKRIFQKNENPGVIGLFKAISSRWEAKKKRPGLKEVLDAATSSTDAMKERFFAEPLHQAWPFGAANLPHLLILAYDYSQHRARYFRTNKRSRAGSATAAAKVRTPSLRDAVHASSNAPVVYFDQPAKIKLLQQQAGGDMQRIMAWDGAMAGYNNPMVAAVTEALANGAVRQQIKIMSIGTSADLRPIRSDLPPGSVVRASASPLFTKAPEIKRLAVSQLVQDILFSAKAILSSPPDVASYTAHLMISNQVPGRGGATSGNMDLRIARFNPVLLPNRSGPATAPVFSKPDDLSQAKLQRLTELDMDVIAQADVNLIADHVRSWLAGKTRNQAIVATGPGGTGVHIGDKWFNGARARARLMGLCP